MSSLFTPGQGFFVRKPSWHGLEAAVLSDWPGTWEVARKEAKLDWDPITRPAVYEQAIPTPLLELDYREMVVDDGWQRIARSDTDATLSYQPTTYRVITNTEYGAVIESVLGMDLGEELLYEGVFELDGGKMVIAVLYFAQPLQVDGDPSQTVRYAIFVTRHDGNGGLRCLLTNTRVVCANTLEVAEDGTVEGVTGFTIRHTLKWDEKVAEVREHMLKARAAGQVYVELMSVLNDQMATPGQKTTYLKRLLPIGDDMGKQQVANREAERARIRQLLAGPTCEGIENTFYGLLQATTEWSDHYRRDPGTVDSYVRRQLTADPSLKARGLHIAKKMAGVK